MVVGTIVGASIFVQPSEVTRAVPSFGGMLLVWIVAGALTWFGASVCAELASAYPRTGGVYVFLREMFSPAVAFLWGWAMFWSMHTGIIAAIATVFARYADVFFHFGPVGAGTAYKLIYNLLGVIQVASTAEAMVQCEAAGIDLHAAAEAFTLGYTGSKHVANHSAVMAEGKRGQAVEFPGRGRLKDSMYGVQLAEKLGRQALVGKAAADVFRQMVDVGMGEANDSEVIDALRLIAARAAAKK